MESLLPTLKVLLIAGGCCHNYDVQTAALKEGIEKRTGAEVTVVLNPSTSKETKFALYDTADWAAGYDVVIHDECSADVTEKPYVDQILAAHRAGVPAVNLHCAMHCYRWGNFRQPVAPGADNAGWYEMLGIQSSGHGPNAPIDVHYVEPAHPIAAGLSDWTTVDEELYNNLRFFGSVTPVAGGIQWTPPSKKTLRKDPDARPVQTSAVLAWTHEYGPKKTPIFCVTLGHFDETVADERYLDLVARGVLWAGGRLGGKGKAVINRAPAGGTDKAVPAPGPQASSLPHAGKGQRLPQSNIDLKPLHTSVAIRVMK